MNMPTSHLNDKTKMVMLFALVALVLGFSWQGSVDDAARSYLNQSIKDAGVIYGSTRLINAVVSVLQSIDVSIVFASVQLGDFLTPLQGTLERFAEVMTYAIVSLTLQRVLIEIVEHTFFNVLLTISGVGLCVAVFTKAYISQAIRLFMTLFFVRFSLALVMMMNMAVDGAFLEQKVQQEHEKMNVIQQELNDTYQAVIGDDEQADSLQTNQEQKAPDSAISTTEGSQSANDYAPATLEEAAVAAKEELDLAAEDDSIWGSIAGSVSSTIDYVDEAISNPTSLVDDVVEGTAQLADATVEAVDSAVDSVVSMKDMGLSKLKALKERTLLWVEGFLTMMALLLLKTIFLPLLFWYILLKGMQLIWAKEWMQPHTEQETKLSTNA